MVIGGVRVRVGSAMVGLIMKEAVWSGEMVPFDGLTVRGRELVGDSS